VNFFIPSVFSQIKKEPEIFVLAGTLRAHDGAQVIFAAKQKVLRKGKAREIW
jgi:1,2-phenylacetyl-CoA epoxidase PaaB subunit